MGHYDDSYAADADRSARELAATRKVVLKKAKTAMLNVASFITALELEDEETQHIQQKLTELEALFEYYTK